MRKHLPDRRHNTTISWLQFDLSIGEYEDGSVGEVFLEANKVGTFVRGILTALARVMSIALQHGVPIPALVSAIKHLNFPPQDGTYKSVPDWVARELERWYNDSTRVPEGSREGCGGEV